MCQVSSQFIIKYRSIDMNWAHPGCHRILTDNGAPRGMTSPPYLGPFLPSEQPQNKPPQSSRTEDIGVSGFVGVQKYALSRSMHYLGPFFIFRTAAKRAANKLPNKRRKTIRKTADRRRKLLNRSSAGFAGPAKNMRHIDGQPLRHQCNRPATSKIIEDCLVIFGQTVSSE